MLIDIDRIVVSDRIRKDFGDIQELADDIKDNGLINPPVVNKEYVLLAGERRLRACKLLGWPQIEVRMMDTRDAEHELEIEVSENENRKDFSRTEREEVYTRYVRMRLQQSGPIGPRVHAVEAEAAKLLGTSRTNMNREREILANRDLLDPADFAEWDEGKLSTNKAYQRIKAAKEQAERERDDARETVSMVQRVADALKAERDEAREEVSALEKQNDELYELANTQQVVEREVVRNVVPEDYEDMKRRVRELEGSNRLYADDNKALREKLESAALDARDHDRLLDDAKAEAAAFWGKYASLDELADVFAAINQLLKA